MKDTLKELEKERNNLNKLIEKKKKEQSLSKIKPPTITLKPIRKVKAYNENSFNRKGDTVDAWLMYEGDGEALLYLMAEDKWEIDCIVIGQVIEKDLYCFNDGSSDNFINLNFRQGKRIGK